MVMLSALIACGGASSGPELPDVELRPLTMPPDRDSRQEALAELAERLFQAMVDADVEGVLYPTDELDELLNPSGVERIEALRLGLPTRVTLDPTRHGRFAQTELAGLCVLGARDEPPGTTIGLSEPAWVIERALIVGQRAGGRRLGAWFEGTFVHSTWGLRAIDLRRVETPRWEHADLELVTCDMQVGLGDPQYVGMVTD